MSKIKELIYAKKAEVCADDEYECKPNTFFKSGYDCAVYDEARLFREALIIALPWIVRHICIKNGIPGKTRECPGCSGITKIKELGVLVE